MLIDFWKILPISKQSSTKSYFGVKEDSEDSFCVEKAPFFSNIAGIIEPFLKKMSD